MFGKYFSKDGVGKGLKTFNSMKMILVFSSVSFSELRQLHQRFLESTVTYSEKNFGNENR